MSPNQNVAFVFFFSWICACMSKIRIIYGLFSEFNGSLMGGAGINNRKIQIFKKIPGNTIIFMNKNSFWDFPELSRIVVSMTTSV